MDGDDASEHNDHEQGQHCIMGTSHWRRLTPKTWRCFVQAQAK